VGPDTVVVIRAHMRPGGHGGVVIRGTVRGGFEAEVIDAEFAAGLDSQPPVPTGCAFWNRRAGAPVIVCYSSI
jgi:hypothetical protein